MIYVVVKVNDELLYEANITEEDQFEIAFAKLLGDSAAVLNVTGFVPSSLEDKKYFNWESQRIYSNDEITIHLQQKQGNHETSFVSHEEEEDEEAESSMVCSFCGKGDLEVKKMIAGENAFICNECVDLCQDIISD
jgi:hypothetical protein